MLPMVVSTGYAVFLGGFLTEAEAKQLAGWNKRNRIGLRNDIERYQREIRHVSDSGQPGDSVVATSLKCLNEGASLRLVNDTLVCLIPKGVSVQHISEYRSISLCNVVYKIVAKALSNRLLFVLGEVISEAQSAIIPGRLITDNVIIGYECIHALRTRNRKKGSMALMCSQDVRSGPGIVGDSVVATSLKCLNEGASLRPVNDTLIYLILKGFSIQHVSEYRPISLCIVVYKIVAKKLSNRLQLVLGEVISEAQSAFITGRLTIDNAIIRKSDDGIGKLLFAGGKEVLIKAVIQSIPTYSMNLFRLPKELLNEIHKVCNKFSLGSNDTKQKIHYASWVKLCKGKNDGGLGFRNLIAFNRALLAKKIWHLEKHPDSLAAKVLKSCYFPSCYVLEEDVKNKGSILWQSLFWGRRLIDAGSRWRVGQGDKLRIFDDKWIPRPVSFKVISPKVRGDIVPMSQLRGLSGSWNTPLIREILLEDDVREILAIPLSVSQSKDILCWHYTSDGNYTVKSGYKLCVFLDDVHYTGSLEWLPTMAGLVSRHIQVEDVCPVCLKENESVFHALWDYKRLKRVRAGCSLLKGVVCSKGIHFQGFFLLCCRTLMVKDLSLLCIIFWRIWFLRNQLVHRVVGCDMEVVVPWCRNFLQEFVATNMVEASVPVAVVNDNVKWKPPDANLYKINTDATLLDERSIVGVGVGVGVGVVIRDHLGQVMGTAALKLEASYSPKLAEAVAIRRGIEFALEIGLVPAVVESVALGVVDLINSKDTNWIELGLVCAKITTRFVRALLWGFSRCQDRQTRLLMI
ncbi:hypothetical protein Ddye_000004 [Dipteronia dyeriana]|uniref:RNase H type-1 domain-containing protein n=1 Tax=Dipteronia dyeriana TaxID=168575 RepID=A0AAD9XLI4_9ROSI|nr:hypothetical protein Ddye_000004 [Dipteronia dyeriana]